MSGDGEIIIVRKRRSDGDEEHHGGVWKLAFADFMTAMMAFFLVMWLINSTSKETKAVIVQYFNPVQLIDANPAHKGLRDPKETGQGKSLQQSASTDKTKPTEKKDIANADSAGAEQALHKTPLKALDDIAQREPLVQTEAASSDPQDPFDRSVAPPQSSPTIKPEGKTTTEVAAPPSKSETRAAEIETQLQQIVDQEVTKNHAAPHLDVRQVEEGILISLTDAADFSMFSVGSIEPRPQLVRMLGEIGKVLAKQRGEIDIGGHTDARSYSGAGYDNWRLSSDRATIVNYMLVRGGLPSNRIGRIVGYAARRLKMPNDPLSPANRRIEILLRGAGK